MKVLRATLHNKKRNEESNSMYNLSPAAGGRWAGLRLSPETTATNRLFERYIQSTERIVDLVEDLLTDLLEPSSRKSLGEAFWRHKLDTAAEFLAEEETKRMEGIAPEGYETLVRYYNLYADACGKAVDAIHEFLDGVGEPAGIHAAFLALKAHNDGRDLYLESIDFPAWL